MDARGRMGALLLGSALGAGLALLLSPRSGQETQDRLKESARTWKDQYDDAVRKGRLRATELINNQRAALDKRLNTVEQAATEAVEEAAAHLEANPPRH